MADKIKKDRHGAHYQEALTVSENKKASRRMEDTPASKARRE